LREENLFITTHTKEESMVIAVPQRLREQFGEEVLSDLFIWLKEAMRPDIVTKDEYREILSRLDLLERDYSGIKEEVFHLRKEINERFDRLNEQFNERFDRMNERFDRMYQQVTSMVKWTVGTIALFGTIITILTAISKFVP